MWNGRGKVKKVKRVLSMKEKFSSIRPWIQDYKYLFVLNLAFPYQQIVIRATGASLEENFRTYIICLFYPCERSVSEEKPLRYGETLEKCITKKRVKVRGTSRCPTLKTLDWKRTKKMKSGKMKIHIQERSFLCWGARVGLDWKKHILFKIHSIRNFDFCLGLFSLCIGPSTWNFIVVFEL